MVSGAQPTPPHASAHTLHHALGNLGGRQKSWMALPPHGPVLPAQLLTQPATNPVPSAPRGRGRPRKTPVENHPINSTLNSTILSRSPYPPEHQQTFGSSSSLHLPNTTAYGSGVPAVLPSHTLTENVASTASPAQAVASWSLNSNNVAVTSNVLASTRIPATRSLEASPNQVGADSVYPEHVTQNSTNGQAQQMPLHPGLPPKDPVQTSRPASQPAWYTEQECLDALQSFQLSVSASPAHTSDRMRMAVLRGAVDKQDWTYLTMHQIYCMLTTCPENLPDELRSLPALPQALRILHDVLQPNQTLSPPILYFFSNFPYPLQTICATWGSTFQQQMHMFSMFVSRSLNYENLRQICDQRRYPPLAQELRVTLGIVSVTFQCLTFTAFLRYIWGSIPPNPILQSIEAEAVALFQQNQNAHLHSLLEPATTLSQEQIASNQACRSKLKEIVKQYENAVREPGPQWMPPYQQHQRRQQQGVFALKSGPNGQISQIPLQPVVRRNQGFGHPPPAPIDSNTLPQPATTLAASSPAQSHQQLPKPLLPPSGRKQPQQRVPNPSRFSLHQANLRSSILCAPSDSSPLYTFHQGYIKPPTRLSEPGRTIETWTFTMTCEEMQAFCKTTSQTMGAPGTRNINENSKMASLRCIKWRQGVEMPNEHVWATTETSWIPYLYISLNDTPLQARKKVYHGKDLPIDVTDLLQEGENVLKMTVISESDDTSHFNHLIAIEAIGVAGHENIKQRCLDQGHVSAEEILQSIKDKLSGSDDDDEISIVQSNMTVGLREPFSQAKMCDIPVRSRACLHNDCFDLEIFLQSRAREGDASVADQWKCPICGVDARPHMLLHDGFIELVKQQLEAQGLAHTRHIVVQQDGSWKPKQEAAEGTSTREGSAAKLPTPVSARASVSRRLSVVPNVEVIDLSD